MNGRSGLTRRDVLKYGVVALAGQAGMGALTAAADSITFDARSVKRNGRRQLLVCGEMHYARSTRAMWPKILRRSKQLGLNAIAAYVFWNVHEPERGKYAFDGERDLGYFLGLCRQEEMAVFLRVGPYCCAEWNYGGFPPYLREEPGMVMRTMNGPYQARVRAYFERLAEEVKPHLATRGGAVELIQVENEYANVAQRYGAGGQEYLRWIVELGRRVGFADVPTTTCEGGAQGAIETANGSLISAQRIQALRTEHPDAPVLWTELYPSWYSIWGGVRPKMRDPREIGAAILDFVSRGGSGWNYYMWHGGTNFGRNSMYLQTTSYDFNAPLDEYGRETEMGRYLSRLHAVLEEQQETLLTGDRVEEPGADGRRVRWKGARELVLEQKDGTHARLLDSQGRVLFDTHGDARRVEHLFAMPEWRTVAQPAPWRAWAEPLAQDRADSGTIAEDPMEQLSLTHDGTDYCWYSAEVNVGADGPAEIVIPYGADYFYAYVDGVLTASSPLPLMEDRGPITPEDPKHPRAVANPLETQKKNGFRHVLKLGDVKAGRHRLDLLATAVGMIKGDWQIANSMNEERKGIWEGVFLNGERLQNWTMRPFLVGERKQILERPEAVEWSADEAGHAERPLRWWRSSLAVPAEYLKEDRDFRIDAGGLGKGMIWLNGHSLGRHWLIAALGENGSPTQRYYHVPADWVRIENEVLVFEEQKATPERLKLETRVYRTA